MKTISRYIIIAVLAFFALDWVVSNPAKIKHIHSELEKTMAAVGSIALSQYEAASKELKKQ